MAYAEKLTRRMLMEMGFKEPEFVDGEWIIKRR